MLRPVGAADHRRLVEILGEPDVARWWGMGEPGKVLEDVLSDEGAAPFTIEVDGEVAGLIRYTEEDDPWYRHAAVDIFLSTERQGRGLGPDALRTLARYLFEERGHHRLTIDPAAANDRAIRAYQRVGFRPVGLMRRYERGPDGEWRDGLLMDLLKEELG